MKPYLNFYNSSLLFGYVVYDTFHITVILLAFAHCSYRRLGVHCSIIVYDAECLAVDVVVLYGTQNKNVHVGLPFYMTQ